MMHHTSITTGIESSSAAFVLSAAMARECAVSVETRQAPIVSAHCGRGANPRSGRPWPVPRGAEMALAALQAQPPAGGAHEIAELISLIETDVLASAGRVETGAKPAAFASPMSNRGLSLWLPGVASSSVAPTRPTAAAWR